ncbi:hypothetical protein LIA77_02100 [Sarocladium implicatum]|nr:hypothetical protein LIA77_02100 [Sarocladium implicatum]
MYDAESNQFNSALATFDALGLLIQVELGKMGKIQTMISLRSGSPSPRRGYTPP